MKRRADKQKRKWLWWYDNEPPAAEFHIPMGGWFKHPWWPR
jgi:hypothetical protein